MNVIISNRHHILPLSCSNDRYEKNPSSSPSKKVIVRKMLKRQAALENESLRILERMNNTTELTRLSVELTSLCTSILDIQETIQHIDTYILFYDSNFDRELDL